MNRQKMTNKFKTGFTLIELLVVVAIISLISAIVLNNVAASRMKAADTKTAEDLRNVRIAAEMYFLDNKKYPDDCTSCLGLANNKNTSVLAQNSYGKNNKLAFFAKFTKIAEAAVTHKQTKLCANFDNIAGQLVQKKYLSSVPVHPYDNDAAGICYKAKSTSKSFASYAVLTQHVSVAGGTINKRTGFIVGDTSVGAMQELGDSIQTIPEADNDYEIPYPADETGLDNNFTDLSGVIDAIEGVTKGKNGTGLLNGIFSGNGNSNNNSGGGNSGGGGTYPGYYDYAWWSSTCTGSGWNVPSYADCAAWYDYFINANSGGGSSGAGDSGGGYNDGGSSSGSQMGHVIPSSKLSKPDVQKSALASVIESISKLLNYFVK